MFRLESPLVPPRAVDSSSIRCFCNKSTALYWATTAQIRGQCPTLPYGCIKKQWYRYYDNKPRIDLGHFFATPIQITSTGPKTIIDILRVHKCLCDQASSFLKNWPHPLHYRLLPVYRAAFVLLDALSLEPSVDGYFVLDEEVQRLTATIVLTGNDSSLSAPVTFKDITGQSLPIERIDTALYEDIQVI